MTPMSLDIEALIARGESQTVEFKERLPPPSIIARLVSAFANNEGGVILIGIREPNQVVGVPIQPFEHTYQCMLEQLTGGIRTEKSVINIGGKSVGVIRIEKSPSLVGTTDGYFMRFGDSIKLLDAKELSSKASHSTNSDQAIDSLAETISKQTEEIGKLRESFEKANSWKRKGLYALFGAIATGAVKAVLVSMGIEIG
jgi:predicted HTH transcriptional regulator